MTDEQFHIFMICLGFGFGSIFWLLVSWMIFRGR